MDEYVVTKADTARWKKLLAEFRKFDASTSSGYQYQAFATRKMLANFGIIDSLLNEYPKLGRAGSQLEVGLKGIEVGWLFGPAIDAERMDLLQSDRFAVKKIIRAAQKNPRIRRSTMFFGRPYVSRQYPWPMINDELGCTPYVQLNLDEIGEKTQRNIGSGLLQLWEGYGHGDLERDAARNPEIVDGFLLRHIPTVALDDPVLTKVPNLGSSSLFQAHRWKLYSDFKPVKLGDLMSKEVRTLLDNLLGDSWHQDAAISDVAKFLVSRDLCLGDTMLFGTPFMIQSSYFERWASKGWRCLMQLDEDEGFNMGDGGTGQVMYRQKRSGKFEYEFTWSCY